MKGLPGISTNRFLTVAFFMVVIMSTHLFFTAKQTGRKERVKNARIKAVGFLQQVQRSDGAICDTINPLFETWETILAATAIYRSYPDTNAAILKKALAFLYANENNDGLICHNRKCRNGYCLETTAVYYDLLKLIGSSKKIGLQSIIALQQETGQWEIGNPEVQEQKDFASVTAFVLAMMREAVAEPVFKKEAIQWILSRQTEQGDWGLAWEYYGCPAYALWPLMKVLRHENSAAAKMAKKKAIAYICSTQNADGSWFYKDSSLQKQTSPELQTALMLTALQQAGKKNRNVIAKGIDFLLYNQQEKGNWNGGFFPTPEKRYSKQEYIFATAMAAEVLNNYLLNMPF